MSNNSSFPWLNITTLPVCTGDVNRNSCIFEHSELSKRNAIAVIRMVVSILSIGGSLSIIISAAIKRQVRNPKVLPIFIISIADFLLALTWVVGGALWFSHVSQRVWCFLPSLLTVILVCVTANLTVVYALSSYANLKHTDFQSILANVNQYSQRFTWHPCKSVLMYITAWILPTFVILVLFASIEVTLHIVREANSCSCWCIPYFGNVIPFAFENDEATVDYIIGIRNLVAMYGGVVGLNYLVAFVLLVVIYWKIMRRIKRLRRQHQQLQWSQPHYGAVDLLIMKGQSQARKRIVYFLTVFIITGLANLLLCISFTIFEGITIGRGDMVVPVNERKYKLTGFPFTVYIIQSITVPLQGFLNAIVYGWTRDDFLHTIANKRLNSGTITCSDDGDSATFNSGSGYTTSLLASGRSKTWSRSTTASGLASLHQLQYN